LLGSVATGVIIFIETFALGLIALTICMYIYKKRVKKLEEDCEAQSDDTH
jgi:thiaminase